MVGQAQAELPNECCGFLAGTVADGVGRVTKGYPLVNEAASPVMYACEGRSLFNAHKDMRRLGIELLAIYHSHPTSAPVPSKTDLARAFWPEAMSLIISLAEAEPVAHRLVADGNGVPAGGVGDMRLAAEAQRAPAREYRRPSVCHGCNDCNDADLRRAAARRRRSEERTQSNRTKVHRVISPGEEAAGSRRCRRGCPAPP